MTYFDMTADALAKRADRIIKADTERYTVTEYFTDHSEPISDDAVDGGREFVEYTCVMIGVRLDYNGGILTRDQARAEFGDEWVWTAEEYAADQAKAGAE